MAKKSAAKAIESTTTKSKAADAVIRFAAMNSDSEVALMAAFLYDADAGDDLAIHALYALREVSRVVASRFDSLVDCANDGGRNVAKTAVSDAEAGIAAIAALRALLVELQSSNLRAGASA